MRAHSAKPRSFIWLQRYWKIMLNMHSTVQVMNTPLLTQVSSHSLIVMIEPGGRLSEFIDRTKIFTMLIFTIYARLNMIEI